MFAALLDGLLSGAHNEHFMKFSTLPGHLDSLANTDNEMISVDLATGHMELSGHVENGLDGGSVVNCYPDRQQISVCMKTKLSPASETHPQNNHAFNVGEEAVMINSGGYGGARPKVPRHAPIPSQTVSDDGGVGVVSSNIVNNSKRYPSVDNSPPSGKSSTTRSSNSSPSDSSVKSQSQVPDVQTQQKSNSAIVGDYFFSANNKECNYSDSTGVEPGRTSRPDSIQTHRHVPSFVDQYVRKDNPDLYIHRWADPACQGMRYADDDDQNITDTAYEANIVFDSSRVITPSSESQKRLYLDAGPDPSENKLSDDSDSDQIRLMSDANAHNHDLSCRKVLRHKSDSSVLSYISQPVNKDFLASDNPSFSDDCSDTSSTGCLQHMLKGRKSSLLSEFERMDITQTASLPSSPFHVLHKPDSPSVKLKEDLIKNGKCRHHSPLFSRKSKLCRSIEVSDDDNTSSGEDVRISSNYKNLESFQKAQLKQKVTIQCLLSYLTFIKSFRLK